MTRLCRATLTIAPAPSGRPVLSAAQRAAHIAEVDAADRRVVHHSARGAIQTSVKLRAGKVAPLEDFGA